MMFWKHAEGKLQDLFKSLIIVSLFAVGCASTPYFVHEKTEIPAKRCDLPTFFGVSPSVPERLIVSIKNGFLYWNKALGKQLYFDIGRISYEHDSKLSTNALIPVSVESPYLKKSCARTAVTYTPQGCLVDTCIKINPRCLNSGVDWFETLVRHESGHALGLRHSDEFTELMYPKIQSTIQHPLDASEDEIRAIKILYGVR